MSAESPAIELRLLEFITREFLSSDAQTPLRPEDDLLTTGIIDSLGVMRLVAFVESEFSVTVPPQHVTIDNFLNIASLAQFIRSLPGTGPATAL